MIYNLDEKTVFLVNIVLKNSELIKNLKNIRFYDENFNENEEIITPFSVFEYFAKNVKVQNCVGSVENTNFYDDANYVLRSNLDIIDEKTLIILDKKMENYEGKTLSFLTNSPMFLQYCLNKFEKIEFICTKNEEKLAKSLELLKINFYMI